MVQLVALSSIPTVDLNKLMLTTDTNQRTTTKTTTLPARLILSISEKHTTDVHTDGVTLSLLELLVAAKNPRVVVGWYN